MTAQVLASVVSGHNALTATMPAGTPQPGDFLVLMFVNHTSISLGRNPPSAVTGGGATWTQEFSGENGGVTMWIGRNPTSTGVMTITRTSGGNSAFSVYWVRGISPTKILASSRYSDTVSVPLVGPLTQANEHHIMLAMGKSITTMPYTGTLPSIPAWQGVENGTAKAAYVAPVALADHSLVSYRSSTGHIMGQFRIGSSPSDIPRNFSPEASTHYTAAMSWDPPTFTEVDGYTIKIGTRPPVTVSASTTEYLAEDLEAGTDYPVEVRSYNELGPSAPLMGAITTQELLPAPTEPWNFVLVPNETSIAVSWDPDTISIIDGYRIRVNGGDPVYIGNVTSYTISDLETGVEYLVQLEAYNVDSTSLPAEGTVRTVVPPVTLLLVWDDPNDRPYHHGTDRGVLYIPGKNPVVWNGITGVTEAGSGSSSVMYRDGRIYYAAVDPGDYEGSLSAYFYPDEFAECLGIPEVAPGLYVDNQKPKRFSLSYRSLIGSGNTGDMFGYQIHLVYNAVATIGARVRKTNTNQTEPMTLDFELVATPVKLPGMRPSAHYIIDTRNIQPHVLEQLEMILYGVGDVQGRMPQPLELHDIMKFGDSITFVDNGDGTWTASGSSANVHLLDDDTWEILNVNGIDHGDGTFTLQDTP